MSGPDPFPTPICDRRRWLTNATLMAVVGGIAVLIVSSIKRAITPNPRVRTMLLVRSTARVIDRFYVDCGRYPTAAEGLAALDVAPPGLRGWAGPYLGEASPRDAYGQDLVYESDAAGEGFRLSSPGEDGLLGTADDAVEDSASREERGGPPVGRPTSAPVAGKQ